MEPVFGASDPQHWAGACVRAVIMLTLPLLIQAEPEPGSPN